MHLEGLKAELSGEPNETVDPPPLNRLLVVLLLLLICTCIQICTYIDMYSFISVCMHLGGCEAEL